MKYQKLTRLFVSSSLKDEFFNLFNVPDIHYLIKVMRKKIHDKILIFNDKEGEYLAELIEIKNKNLVFKLLEHVKLPAKEKELNLIFAPIKQPRMAFLLEKATELGVTNLIPVQTKHAVVDKINITKWQAYVKEAAEQCGRLSIPTIHSMTTLEKFLKSYPPENKIILCNEKEHNLPIQEIKKEEEVNLMIGPEGGFSEQELELLNSHKSIISVHLGTRILRAETAAIVALFAMS